MQIHRDVDAGLLLVAVKDLRRVDTEDVLVVRVDVRCLVKENVRVHGDARIRLLASI